MHIVRTYCVPDVCTYCDGARHFHNLKVWTKSYPTVVIAPSNFIPGAVRVRLRREQNFRKFSKILKIFTFSIFSRFLKILMILIAEFNLSHRVLGMELEGGITTVG